MPVLRFFLAQDVIKNGHEMVLIFEDDIKFEPFFRDKLESAVKELKARSVMGTYLGSYILFLAIEKVFEIVVLHRLATKFD